MNDHFSSMLAPAQANTKLLPYIKAASFEGKKEGYKFQKGPNGIGYYIDAKQRSEEVHVLIILFAFTCIRSCRIRSGLWRSMTKKLQQSKRQNQTQLVLSSY